MPSLVGSEMCIRDRHRALSRIGTAFKRRHTRCKTIDDVVESPVASNHRQTGYNTYGDFERNMSICRLGTSRSGIHTGRAKSQPPDSLSARSKYTLGFFSQDEVHIHERAVLNNMSEPRRGSSNRPCAGFKRQKTHTSVLLRGGHRHCDYDSRSHEQGAM